MEAASATGIEAISSMQLIVSARDQVLARYGNQLAALGEGQARTAMSRALNHEGDKRRTQVKRALVKQTGINYGAVDKATATVRATPATLTYTLKARGDETNIAWFGGVQRRKGVSASPWNRRRIFTRSFIVPRFGRAFMRTSRNRLPIRPLYGPNLARELLKDSSAAAWQSGIANIVARVGHEIGRMLPP
jgi:hypothetical protein